MRKKLNLLLLSALFCVLSFSVFAQKGTLTGKIIDKNLGEELIGVSVRIEGTSLGAVTDIEGKFLIALEPGKYTISINYSSYRSEKVEVEVKANEVSYLNIALTESSTVLTETVITYTVQKSSALALLTERKNAAVVSDGVSAELIRRTPDRTTSDVLKRVTGASIQEGKFAVIRGMNDRYNAGYLDGALLPSTEADRKAFAFDVVPASLIDNLQIIKAGSPDLVGDFGGGIIRINTKAVPEKRTQNISFGLQTNSITQFREFTSFDKYSGETFNILSSKRNLPNLSDGALKTASAFPNAEERQRLARTSGDFTHNWANTTADAMPNTRFTYALGMPIQLSDEKKVGVILALNYANTRRFSENEINTFDGTGQTAALRDRSYLQNISSGGIFNVNYVASKTQISLRNLLNINTDHNTVIRTGLGNVTDAISVQNTANLLNHNRLYNSIVSLKQVVGDNLFDINASVNFSNVRRRTPDYRIISYTKTPDTDDFRLTIGDFFNTSTGRFYSDLKENLFGGNVELEKELNTKNIKTRLKLGAFYQNRDRDFFGRSFVYNGNQPATLAYNPEQDLAADKIGSNALYLVEKTSDDVGYYQGKQTSTAFYAGADQKFNSKFRAVYGLRYESVDIKVSNDKVNMEIANVTQNILLPSVNLSYSLGEKANLRAAYFRSVNRPEFRELAPFAFFVFDKNADIRGNQDLQIANLNNYDLRLELFPSGSQVLSVGGFYKTISNPVEFSIDVTQPFTTFTYENEKSATIYGVELEARKNFDFLGDKQVWNDIVVFSNLALIHSELQFEVGTQAKEGRPLQGQSPFVLNAGIQYENEENGWFGSVVANRVGRRIAFVGVDPKFGDTRQDIFENPRTVIDLQVGKNIGKWNLKLTLGDILRQDLIFYQDADQNGKYNAAGDRQMFRYLNGYTASVTAGLTF